MGACEVDPETLRLCGYVEVSELMVGDGQGVSFNLVNCWSRLTVTAVTLGGDGSALGKTKQVTLWGVPAPNEECWRYDLSISFQADDLLVLVMRSRHDNTDVQQDQASGGIVELDPPTELEMLAAQANAPEFADLEE